MAAKWLLILGWIGVMFVAAQLGLTGDASAAPRRAGAGGAENAERNRPFDPPAAREDTATRAASPRATQPMPSAPRFQAGLSKATPEAVRAEPQRAGARFAGPANSGPRAVEAPTLPRSIRSPSPAAATRRAEPSLNAIAQPPVLGRSAGSAPARTSEATAGSLRRFDGPRLEGARAAGPAANTPDANALPSEPGSRWALAASPRRAPQGGAAENRSRGGGDAAASPRTPRTVPELRSKIAVRLRPQHRASRMRNRALSSGARTCPGCHRRRRARPAERQILVPPTWLPCLRFAAAPRLPRAVLPGETLPGPALRRTRQIRRTRRAPARRRETQRAPVEGREGLRRPIDSAGFGMALPLRCRDRRRNLGLPVEPPAITRPADSANACSAVGWGNPRRRRVNRGAIAPHRKTIPLADLAKPAPAAVVRPARLRRTMAPVPNRHCRPAAAQTTSRLPSVKCPTSRLSPVERLVKRPVHCERARPADAGTNPARPDQPNHRGLSGPARGAQQKPVQPGPTRAPHGCAIACSADAANFLREMIRTRVRPARPVAAPRGIPS